MNNDNSGINTILLVIVVALIVGLGVWFLKGGMNAEAPSDDTLDVNVEIPTPNDNGGEDQPQNNQP